MMGTEMDEGITQRALRKVFNSLRENTDQVFLLRASYMELYNEEIYDLLTRKREPLQIRGTDVSFLSCWSLD